MINACDSVCGWTEGDGTQGETWCWDERVESLVKHKRKLWKQWQKEGSKEKYLEAKTKAKSCVWVTKRKAREVKFSQLESSNSKNFIFKLGKENEA